DHGLSRLTRGLVVHSTQIVYPHSGSVHHATRLDLRLEAGIHGAISRTHHLTVPMKQTDHGAIVDQQAALGGGATSKRQGQARVVELAVPVLHPALQSLAAHAGQAIQSLTTRKKLSGSQTGAPRQGIVSLEADAIERCLPALVARHDEWNGAGNVRRVVQKLASFVQGFAYQRDIALSEITYAAMYELGGTGRGPLGEIPPFEQNDRKTAQTGIQGQAQAGGAAAHNEEVHFAHGGEPLEQVG